MVSESIRFLLSLLTQKQTVKELRITAKLWNIAYIIVLTIFYFTFFVKEPKRIQLYEGN